MAPGLPAPPRGHHRGPGPRPFPAVSSRLTTAGDQLPKQPSAPALLSPTARCEGPRKAALTARQRPTALDGARGPHDRLRHDSAPDDGLALSDTSPRLPLTTCHPHTGLTRTCTHTHIPRLRRDQTCFALGRGPCLHLDAQPAASLLSALTPRTAALTCLPGKVTRPHGRGLEELPSR